MGVNHHSTKLPIYSSQNVSSFLTTSSLHLLYSVPEMSSSPFLKEANCYVGLVIVTTSSKNCSISLQSEIEPFPWNSLSTLCRSSSQYFSYYILVILAYLLQAVESGKDYVFYL